MDDVERAASWPERIEGAALAMLPRALAARLGPEPVRFGLVGVANTAVGLSIIYGCKLLLGMGDVAANVTGYAVGVTVSYVLNSRWTFAYGGRVLPALARFVATFLTAYAVNLATVLWLIRAAAVNSYLAHFLGMVVYTIVFFLLSRHFVFRERAMPPPSPR